MIIPTATATGNDCAVHCGLRPITQSRANSTMVASHSGAPAALALPERGLGGPQTPMSRARISQMAR
jgi:hypothetical protein